MYRTPYVKRTFYSLLFLFMIMLSGMMGFMFIEDFTPIDAIYMTIITVSTVGYGTLHPLTEEGKLFISVLIILSTGTFIFAITSVISALIEGEIRQAFHIYRVSKKVSRIENHTIICGLGRTGREVVLELLRQEEPFLVIEEDREILNEFSQHHQILSVIGDATQEDVLEEAQIDQAHSLITALSSDAENVYITLTAREMNPKIRIVARASMEASVSKLKRAGANHVIMPNLLGGQKMANIVTRPALNEFLEMVSGQGQFNLHLEDILCADHPRLIGHTLAELHIRSHTGALVLGYKHGDALVELNPKADRVLSEKDRLFLVGTPEQLESFKKQFLDD